MMSGGLSEQQVVAIVHREIQGAHRVLTKDDLVLELEVTLEALRREKVLHFNQGRIEAILLCASRGRLN